MQNKIERFQELVKDINEMLRKVPTEFQKYLQEQLDELKKYVESNPELIPQTIPVLFNICTSIAEGEYAKTAANLALLVILIRCKSARTHE